MPSPLPNESKKDYLSRCIPYVMKEGTASSTSQAAAICHSLWKKYKNKDNNLMQQALMDDI